MEMRKFLPDDDALSDDFEKHDRDKDGKLNREEYTHFVSVKVTYF